MNEKPGQSRLLIALLVLALGAAGAFAALWLGTKDTSSEDVTSALSREMGAVEQTATEVIEALFDYDATSLDGQREKLLALSTGTFRAQYEELLADDLGSVLESTAASSQGDIADGPDVAFETSERASAIARVVQEVSARDSATRSVFYVMRLTLIHTGDEWKADALQVLSQQST